MLLLLPMTMAKVSAPVVRIAEFIDRELQWEAGDDPVKQFNVRGNWTTRRFGNSGDYRHVDVHTCDMLGMGDDECQKWLFDFWAPMRETMKAGD